MIRGAIRGRARDRLARAVRCRTSPGAAHCTRGYGAAGAQPAPGAPSGRREAAVDGEHRAGRERGHVGPGYVLATPRPALGLAITVSYAGSHAGPRVPGSPSLLSQVTGSRGRRYPATVRKRMRRGWPSN
jgi:hypothetical protein